MKVGLLVFPGSNCDRDLAEALHEHYNAQVEYLWHTNSFEPQHDFYFLPGGFSYGDYLRSGAMASRSLSIESLRQANQKNIPIVGICNGFQVLTEAHFLPGALIRNASLKHVCRWTNLSANGSWKNVFPQDYALPVSHSEGNYICSKETLKELQDNERILFRYQENFNGSTDSIAGIQNEKGNVIGLMPHPERALHKSDGVYGNRKFGKLFFDKVFSSI